jgi:hypothetical protein
LSFAISRRLYLGARRAVVSKPRLGGNAKTLGYSIDVIEIRDYLNTTRNALIVESAVTQTLDVCGVNGAGFGCDPFSEFEQFSGWLIQTSRPPTDRESINHLLVVDLIPEVV